MRLETLLSGLNNPQPAVRLDVVRVLGMLDETRALPPLRARYPQEDDPQVREAITWAGKRLYQAQQAGYTTLDELFRYFRVDHEIETAPDINEEEIMRRMQDQFSTDLRDMQTRAGRKKLGFALAAGLGGAAAGFNPVGMAFNAIQPGADGAGSNLGGPNLVVKRTPATAPSSAPIDVWLKRMQTALKPEQREAAIIELQQLNNPRALPFMAVAFLTDESPKVRQAAQRYGKILYWSAIYWAMEHDGTLRAEMERRAAALGKTLKMHGADAPPPSAAEPGAPAAAIGPGQTPQRPITPPEPPQDDIAEILRKAEEGRKRRKSKGR